MRKGRFNNQKGFVLLGTYIMLFFVLAIAGSAFAKSLYEAKQVSREMDRVSSHYAAEAAVQSALAQIGLNAYTGFINTTNIAVVNFQSVSGDAVGGFTANVNYPNQADWVIVTATGTVNGNTRNVEARIFLDSNLSKYLVYSTKSDFYSGTNAQYGFDDGTNPQGVPSNEDDRAAMYFTGNYHASGANVQVYGDVHAQGYLEGTSSSQVHGDSYAGDFVIDGNGNVTNDGVTGSLVLDDGFNDDVDRNGDGTVDALDAPEHHDLTADGVGDSHATETLTPLDNAFYQANNNMPSFFGGSPQSRYIEFQQNGSSSQLVEYNSDWTTVTNTHNLPDNAIVYVNGDIYVKGEVEGRVSVVSTDDIFFDANVTYTGASSFADSGHSVAFLAKDKIYFREADLEVSGILYAENADGGTAIEAGYDTSGTWNPDSKTRLRLYGNRIMDGQANTSYYGDRVFGYDQNLKYYRPPGLPVQPELRLVREV